MLLVTSYNIPWLQTKYIFTESKFPKISVMPPYLAHNETHIKMQNLVKLATTEHEKHRESVDIDNIQVGTTQMETPPLLPRPEICLQYSWQLSSHAWMVAPSTFRHTGMQSLAHSGTSSPGASCATTIAIIEIRSRGLVLFIMAMALASSLSIVDHFFCQGRMAGPFMRKWRQEGWATRYMLGKKSAIPRF